MNLKILRKAMAEAGLDAYIVPGSDAHQSEYTALYWQTRRWLSGFTGSNGLVALTADKAGLWTDGRYFIQADAELKGSGIDLYKMNEPGVLAYSKWLVDNLPQGATIGFDGRVLSVSEFETLKNEFGKRQKDASFSYDRDLAGELWETRPVLPKAPAFAHDIKYAGRTAKQKLADVRAQMAKKGASMYLTAALDEIAWLANIRGSDIPNTPVVHAYLLIADAVCLFVEEQKIDGALREVLSEDFILCPYEGIFDCPYFDYAENKKLIYNPSGISVKLFDSVKHKSQPIKSPSIIADLKSTKNDTEIKNLRNAFLKEGVAIVKLLKWLDEVNLNENDLYESDVQEKVSKLRKEQELCLGDSFTTIAAYGKNAAITHYSPQRGNCSKITRAGFLLIDTGGQYLDGTTDTTRTVVMGPLTDEMRRDFTLVLKGHIALATTKFIEGTTGIQIDAIARRPMWQAGMDYKHGTGHGLGFCLGVHEGPHTISPRINKHKLKPGMLCSIEPGIYKEGRYGIRTENIVIIKELEKNEFGTFLGFEPVTFSPIDSKAIDRSLLTAEEVDYLEGYHKKVYENLSPYLDKPEQEWLLTKTNWSQIVTG